MVNKNKLTYLLLIGQRNNGKSFAVKKLCLKEFLKNGKKFIYLRRYDNDIKDKTTNLYFKDKNLDIKKLSKGKYIDIISYRGKFYFVDDDNNRVECGYCMSLNNYEHYKSLVYTDTFYIIFEEFITDRLYLYNECDKLDSIISSVFRNTEETACVFMIGNTLSRINPYINNWDLDGLKRQKQGTLSVYHYNGNINIGVYYTPDNNQKNNFVVGKNVDNIIKGDWLVNTHLNIKDFEDSTSLYFFVLEIQKNRFSCYLKKYKDDYFLYIEPKTTEIKNNTRVVSDEPNISIYYTKGFKPINDIETFIFKNLILNDKIVFSDDLTGTEFYQLTKGGI